MHVVPAQGPVLPTTSLPPHLPREVEPMLHAKVCSSRGTHNPPYGTACHEDRGGKHDTLEMRLGGGSPQAGADFGHAAVDIDICKATSAVAKGEAGMEGPVVEGAGTGHVFFQLPSEPFAALPQLLHIAPPPHMPDQEEDAADLAGGTLDR